MTIKEAILKSLDDLHQVASYLDVYNNILKNKYCEFKGEIEGARKCKKIQ